jgi:hypothetical protein
MSTSSTVSIDYVLVYIIEKDDTPRCETLRKYFDHPIFLTYVVRIDCPEDWISRHSYLSREEAEELYQYKWCLADAKKRMSTNYTLIIKDICLTNTSSRDIAEMITAACQDRSWQICYLNKWQDRCDLHTDRMNLVNSSTVLARTYSPNGCCALLFSPDGRDIILGEKAMTNNKELKFTTSLSTTLNREINQRNLIATCFVPNLFSIDPATVQNYEFCQECQQSNNNGSSGGYYGGWLIIGLFIFVALLIALLCIFFPRH